MALQFFNSRFFESNTFEAGFWIGAGVAVVVTVADAFLDYAVATGPPHFVITTTPCHYAPQTKPYHYVGEET